MKRIVAILLSGVLLTPATVFAQGPTGAGVVTTLEGHVTARRVALPNPIPLKFRDEVFLQDTVTTGDKSLARMLLGGKAVVTVRERSVLTITEVPGRSIIELESGKFALAVAREKMRPGEEIQIRTPNAIAGVRGTVVITEVNRQTAQLGRAAASVVTRFWVLRGSITAQPLDGSTRQPVGTPVPVGSMQAYTGAGMATPNVAPFGADQIDQITAGLKPSGPKGGSEAAQEQVKAQAVEIATTLLGALTGTGSGVQMAAIVAAAPTTVDTAIATAETLIPTLGICDKQESCAATFETFIAEAEKLIKGIDVILTDVGGDVTFGGIFFGNFGFASFKLTDQTIRKFDGAFTSLSPSALVELNNAGVLQVAFGQDVDVFQVRSGANVSLAGPLATLIDSLLFTTGSLLDIAGGSLAGTSSSPLFSLDPSFLLTLEAPFKMKGGSLTLAGPLLSDVGGLLFSSAEVLRMHDGATLVGTSPAALFELDGTLVSAARQFLAAGFDTTTLSPSLSLSGPFLSASTASLTTGNGAANVTSFLSITDGTQVSSTSPLPFMTFTSSSLDTAGAILDLRRATGPTPTRLTLGGPLLVATDSTFNHTSLGFAAEFGLSTVACCSAFFIGQGGRLTSTTDQALLQFTRSSVIGNDAQSGGIFFHVADTFTGAPSSEPILGGTVSLAGPLLHASASTISSLFSLVHVQRSSVTSTSASPFVALTDSAVTLGGTDPLTGGAAIGNLLFVVASVTAGAVGPAASTTLGGPLVNLTRSSFNANSGNIVSVINGGTYTAGGAGAMMQLESSVLNGFNLLNISGLGGPTGAAPATVSLAGPVLSAVNSTITLGSNVLASFGGSTLASTTTLPLIQLVGTNLTAGTSFGGAEVLQLNGVSGPAGLATLGGPVLAASGGSVNIAGALFGSFAGGQLVVAGSTDPLFAFNGGTHAFGNGTIFGADTAFSLNGVATETALEVVEEGDPDIILELGTRKPVQAAGSLLEMTGATATTKSVLKLDTALLEASAPVLNLKGNSTLTVANDAIDLVSKAKLTTGAVNPLMRLDASTLTVTSGNLISVRNGSFLNVGGDVLALNNGSTLNINNGTLLFAQGGSFVKAQGALINFGGVGNVVNIANTLCASSCATIGGLNVFLSGGAIAGNVSITSPITNPAGGTINLSAGGGTAHISVDGAATKVQIGSGT